MLVELNPEIDALQKKPMSPCLTSKKQVKIALKYIEKKKRLVNQSITLLFVASHQCIITNITKEDNIMNKQTLLICGLATTAVLGAFGTVAVAKAPTFENFSQVKASAKTLTLDTTEKLQAITFSELDLGATRKDKQFQISLGNDKYINGALIFSDCGNQFVGDDLSDSFGLDNSEQTVSNAFNFNFLFSFENNITDASVNFTVVDTLNATSTTYAYRLRFAYKVDDDSSQFYTRIKDNLNDITRYESGFFNGNYTAYTEKLSSTEQSKSISGDKGTHNHNTIVDFNFNSQNHVPAKDKVTFQITSISFTYECK